MDTETERNENLGYLTVARASDLPPPAPVGAAIPDGAVWGKWRYNKKNLTLVHLEHSSYEIDLEKCATCAEVLAWLCRIAGKSRGFYSFEDVGYLIVAINKLLAPQSMLCGGGIDKGRLDVKKHLRQGG